MREVLLFCSRAHASCDGRRSAGLHVRFPRKDSNVRPHYRRASSQVPAQLLFYFLETPQLRSMWDPVMQKRELLLRIDNQNMIQRVVCVLCVSVCVCVGGCVRVCVVCVCVCVCVDACAWVLAGRDSFRCT